MACTCRSAVFRYDDGEEVNDEEEVNATLVVAGRPWFEASLIFRVAKGLPWPPLVSNTLIPKVL